MLELRPRRALLYVPGDSERKICKAAGLGADVTCLDLEDAVAANRKADARGVVAQVLLGPVPTCCVVGASSPA